MPAQQPEYEYREMRSELNVFIRDLKSKGILDGAAAITEIKDDIGKPEQQNGKIQWTYKTGKVVLRLAATSVCWPERASALDCIMDLDVSGTLMSAKGTTGTKGFAWNITNMKMHIEFAAQAEDGEGGWSQFWHFDTHRDETDAEPPDEAHPLFHLHFGGGRMGDRRNLIPDVWGKSLELHCPRLAHPPMDLILAFDFILSNASGLRWRDELGQDKNYRSAVCNAQRRFWKPYQRALADFFECTRHKQENHPALLYWPTLRATER